MIYCPVNYYEGNILFNRSGQCFAVYKLEGRPYNFKSTEAKLALHAESNSFLQGLSEDVTHVKILGKPFATSIRDLGNRLKKTFKGDLADVARVHQDGVTQHLIDQRGDEGNEVQQFIVMKLSPSKLKGVPFWKSIRYAAEDQIRGFGSFLGWDDKEIPVRIIKSYLDTEKYLFNKFKGTLKRAGERDQEWLIRQPFFRGVGDPKLRSESKDPNESEPWSPGYDLLIRNGDAVISPRTRDIMTLGCGVYEHKKDERIIKITHPDGKISYQTFLSIGFLPGMYFPDYSEWIYRLKNLPFPVEYMIDIDMKANEKAIESVGLQSNKVDDQIEHTQKTNDTPRDVLRGYEKGKKLEDYLRSTKEAFTLTKFNLCLSAADEEELKQRVIDVIQFFDDYEIEVHNPISDQEKMFMEFFPGTFKESLSYCHKISTKCIASYMYDAIDLIGSPLGFFIGTTGVLEKPVFIDPREASQVDKSPSLLSVGGLGGGKSFLMKLLAYLNSLSGGKSLIIDPKTENENWLEHLPHLEGYYETMKLTGEEDQNGKLDPYMVYEVAKKTGKAKEAAKKFAYQMAVSILSFYMDCKSTDDMSLCISAACEYARDHEVPCMERVMEFVEEGYKEDPELRDFHDVFIRLKRHMKKFRDFQISSLIFGDGLGESITIDKPLTILQLQGLTIPSKQKARLDYTPDEVATMGVLISLCSLMRKFAFSDRSIFKFIGMDERWFLERVEIGKSINEEIIRQGRTINCGMHLIDQNASGFDQGIRNLIGIKFVYKCNDTEEAKEALDLLKLEKTKENIDRVLNLADHHVLMSDLRGRVSDIHIDAVYTELKAAFKTRPEGSHEAA